MLSVFVIFSSLCDGRTGEAKIWSYSWSWRTFSVFWWQDLLLDLDLCTCVCVVTERDRDSLCVSALAHKAGGQSMFPHVPGLKPCVVANQQQAQLYI